MREESSKLVMGRAHDAEVAKIDMRESEIVVHLARMLVEEVALDGTSVTRSCHGTLVLTAPGAVEASWHRMSLWVMECHVLIGGIAAPLETLLVEQVDVTLEIVWSNGATFRAEQVRSAKLDLTIT